MRMRRLLPLFVLTATAFSALAGPPPEPLTVTSISLREGPVTGGTVLEIRGTGFERDHFSPVIPGTRVFFGETPALSVGFSDSTRLEVVTPPRLPGAVTVTLKNVDESTVQVPNGFTFVGDADTAFDAFLFPIFTPPTNGAFGSRFVTTARIWNGGEGRLELYGADAGCQPPAPVGGDDEPFTRHPNQEDLELSTLCSTWPARLVYVPKTQSKNLESNLRVADVSRQAENHGVEIPVVPVDHFTNDRVALVGVPSDPRFRLTLRIYAYGEGDRRLRIWFDRSSVRTIELTPGRNRYEPAYATFTAFPKREELRDDPSAFRVIVETARDSSGGRPAADAPRIWAFVSVTNNDTQVITTVTPQRQ